jgi:hypothetical protein
MHCTVIEQSFDSPGFTGAMTAERRPTAGCAPFAWERPILLETLTAVRGRLVLVDAERVLEAGPALLI